MQVNKQSITIIREWIRDNDLGKYFFVNCDKGTSSCLYMTYSQRVVGLAFKGYINREWVAGVIKNIRGLFLCAERKTFIIRSKHDVKEMMTHGLNDLCSRTTDLRLKVLLEVIRNASE